MKKKEERQKDVFSFNCNQAMKQAMRGKIGASRRTMRGFYKSFYTDHPIFIIDEAKIVSIKAFESIKKAMTKLPSQIKKPIYKLLRREYDQL